jgi:hypothetical protein
VRKLGLVVVLVLAACGGGGSFQRDATADCLRDAGADVSTTKDDLDYVAQAASGGGIYAKVDGTAVTVSFDRTEQDAERTEAAYKVFADAFDSPVDDILKRKGNAVLMWDATPTGEQSSTVEDCLKG